jgi:chromosome partitioning protein
MKIISIANQKGGVGKTTSTINIGAGLAQLGKNVLLIDLDPQAHLGYGLGIPVHELERTIYDLLKGQAKLEDVIIDRNGIKLVPSTLELSGAEIELSGIAGKEFLLRESLEPLKDESIYDYVLLDCPPSLSILTLNAFTASKEIYIPLQTEFLALVGVTKLVQTVEIVKKRLNKDLEITGVIATQFSSQKKLHKEVVDKIKDHFGEKLFKTYIRDNISIAEASSFGKTIYEYKSNSPGAEDYLSLSQEIINRS